MKKIQLLTSIILTLLMIIAPQSIALAADDSSQASAVSLIYDGKRRGYHLFPFTFKRCKRTV